MRQEKPKNTQTTLSRDYENYRLKLAIFPEN